MSSSTQRKLWEGKVPVCFTIAEHEVALSKSTPFPMYCLLSRMSYLTMLNSSISEYFADYLDKENTKEVWYEYAGKPLHWNFPTGVLFDLHCDISKDVPWNVTVHFQNYPKDVIINCLSDEAIRTNYFSSLKEADFLKHSGDVISYMSKDEQQKLWHGLKTDNFQLFWGTNKKFMEGHKGSSLFQSIPIKVYAENKVLQRRIDCDTDNSEELTLKTALQLIDAEQFSDDKLIEMKVISQGISPPLHSSLHWLSVNLSYPDNFLHVCVRKPS